MHNIQTGRIYNAFTDDGGYRILVDRLWPRGISRKDAALSLWIRDIAPSTELRKNFAHQKERFAGFEEAYRSELENNPKAPEFVELCEDVLLRQDVVLLYAAKDEVLNNACVLCRWLQDRIEKDRPD